MRKNLLVDMLRLDNPSGKEHVISPLMIEELNKLDFEVSVDSLGNIYATRGKAEKYPLLNAHLDQVELWWSGYGKYSKTYGKDSKKSNNAYLNFLYETDYYQDLDNPLALETLDDVYELMDDNDKETWFSCADCTLKGCEGRILGRVCPNFDLRDESVDVLYDVASSWGLDVSNYTKVADEDDEEDDKEDKEFFVYENKGNIYGSGGRVLGGDDKCGLFIALEVARVLRNEPMKILFTVEEEEGCVGISHFVKENEDWFDDISYSITIDRRYGNNLLWSQCGKRSCSNAFASRLARAGIECGIPIEITDGSVADVIHIRELVKESVNISAGYYEPHSEEEYVSLEDVVKIIKWVRKFIISEKNYKMKGGK